MGRERQGMRSGGLGNMTRLEALAGGGPLLSEIIREQQ
jgi:hypothetical protein